MNSPEVFQVTSEYYPSFESPQQHTWTVCIGEGIPIEEREEWKRIVSQVQRAFPKANYNGLRATVEHGKALKQTCFLAVGFVRDGTILPWGFVNKSAYAVLSFENGSKYGQAVYSVIDAFSGHMALFDVGYYMHGPGDGANTDDTQYHHIPVVVVADVAEASDLLSARYTELFGKPVGVEVGVVE